MPTRMGQPPGTAWLTAQKAPDREATEAAEAREAAESTNKAQHLGPAFAPRRRCHNSPYLATGWRFLSRDALGRALRWQTCSESQGRGSMHIHASWLAT